MTFTVYSTDNFQDYVEDGADLVGEYGTEAEAIAAARDVVDKSLRAQHKPGMSAAELVERWFDFGDSAAVLDADGRSVAFGSADYARQRAEEILTRPAGNPGATT